MADYDLIPVSFDGNAINDGTNYEAGFSPAIEWGLPAISPRFVGRDGSWPIISGIDRRGNTLQFIVRCVGSNKRLLRDQLMQYFDPDDETAKTFVVEDQDGTLDRSVEAICVNVVPIIVSGIANRDNFLVTLAVDGDQRWKSTSQTTVNWSVTATPDSEAISVSGTADVYPTYEITPTSTKTGNYAYRQFIPIVWRSDNVGTKYPFRIGPIDTATLVTAVKMQASGNDLRVFVDGREIERWIVQMNNANTYIWCNFNFPPQVNDELITAIAASGSIDSIEIGEGIYDFPKSGVVYIGTEVLTYTDRDLAEEKLTGITRAAKGSSMGAHSVGDTVYLLHHEVYIKYGNAAISAPTTDNTNRPMFDYSVGNSNNTLWKYTEFGTTGGNRAASWRGTGNVTTNPIGGLYTDVQQTYANPFEYAGAWIEELAGHAFGWSLESPTGIVNAAWVGGEHKAIIKTDFVARCMYWIRDDDWWTTQYLVPDPANNNTWDTWSKAVDASDWSEADVLALALYFHPSHVGVNQVTVYLSTTETPSHSVSACAEQGNYTLSCGITHNTSGDVMYVNLDMSLNDTIIIDTENETVTLESDNTSQLQAVSFNSVRQHWLKLTSGGQTLTYRESGVAAVTVDVKYYNRYY